MHRMSLAAAVMLSLPSSVRGGKILVDEEYGFTLKLHAGAKRMEDIFAPPDTIYAFVLAKPKSRYIMDTPSSVSL